MKLLAIMGCAKNGNTTEVVKYFEKKLMDSIECEVEYLYLMDYNIDFCTGCHNCIFIGEDKCPHSIEVKMIEDKILNFDGVILATPGYMFSVTGIMKNFLDHVAYNCHRPKYFNKKAFLIANCTKWQEKSVFTPMETWVKGSGFTLSGKIYVDMLPFPMNKKEMDKRRKLIEKGTINYAKELSKENQINPNFGDVMIFHVFRTLCEIAPKILKADYEYFKAKDAYSYGTRWYIPTKISSIKHHVANLIEKKMKREIHKMIDIEKVENTENRYKINL